MGAIAALQYAVTLLDAIPRLVQAGADIAAVVQEHRTKLDRMIADKTDPTPEDWERLNSQIDALRKQLHNG